MWNSFYFKALKKVVALTTNLLTFLVTEQSLIYGILTVMMKKKKRGRTARTCFTGPEMWEKKKKTRVMKRPLRNDSTM